MALPATAGGAPGTKLTVTQQKAATIRGLLDRSKEQIALALPKHMNADRLLRVAMTSIQRNPVLLECTGESLLGCIMESSALGLEPDGVTGRAYLIPYKDNKKNVTICTLIVGYRGMIDLARRSGEVRGIYSHVVHRGDAFRYTLGLERALEHVPLDGSEENEALYVYAVAEFKDGGRDFEVMSRGEVEKIRKRSRAKDSGPWITDYEEMMKKTVIRRLFKRLPISVEVMRAVEIDERADRGADQNTLGIFPGTFEEMGDDPPPSADPLQRLADDAKKDDPPPPPAQEPSQEPSTETVWMCSAKTEAAIMELETKVPKFKIMVRTFIGTKTKLDKDKAHALNELTEEEAQALLKFLKNAIPATGPACPFASGQSVVLPDGLRGTVTEIVAEGDKFLCDLILDDDSERHKVDASTLTAA